MKVIINGKIITKDEVILGKNIIFDKQIIDITDNLDLINNSNIDVIDAKGDYVSPGFIDLHIHGSGGKDAMDGDIDGLRVISSTISKNGVTAFLPTTMTMDIDTIYKALDTIRQAMKKQMPGAKVVGAHMEGPFINEKYKGAQAAEHILKPEFKLIEQYMDIIKIITLAPEKDHNYEFINKVKNNNVVLSIGHSNATYEEAMKAIDAGITHATHTFNAMTPLHHRKPGIVGAIFNSSIVCELIADKIHVHPSLFQFLVNVKGKDKVVLITDSMRAGCMKDGEYELGGQKVLVKDNSARLEDGVLAGSVLTLNRAVSNIKNNTNLKINEVINMVSLNPAKEIKLDKQKGSLEINKDADIVIFDEDINVKETIVEGNVIYKR
ncbi:MAG: nagA [Clostridiaceae bacterium]|jgi:N-acetylglucosamine-6-phosphate deacetylase|nr:nagA [Clostridiaceae bacterium]